MCKIGKYLDIKNCTCKKRTINNLVLTCEYEIVNTTETTLINSLDQKAVYEKEHCFISYYFISNCMFIFVYGHYYYTKHWLKTKHLLPY